jgi:hypothetical protein
MVRVLKGCHQGDILTLMDHMNDPPTHTTPNTGYDSFNHNPPPLVSFHPEMALFCNLPPASPERVQARDGGQAASISGIPCATYHMYVSAQSLDFFALALLRSVPRLRRGFPEALTLQKNVSFLIWKLLVPF